MDHISNRISFKINKWFNSLVFIGLLSVSLINPVNGQVIASFSDSRDYLLADDGQFQTVFTLEASKEFYELLVSKALEMPETLTFKSEKIKKNFYSCSILYLHPTDAYYVKKTMLNLGIEQLRINNNIYSLPDYDPASR